MPSFHRQATPPLSLLQVLESAAERQSPARRSHPDEEVLLFLVAEEGGLRSGADVEDEDLLGLEGAQVEAQVAGELEPHVLVNQVVHVKEIKLRPKISEHDYNFKLRHAQRFLEDRDKVKVTMIFRGREMAHQDLGRNLMERFSQEVSEIASLETPLKQEGRNLVMILAPKQK